VIPLASVVQVDRTECTAEPQSRCQRSVVLSADAEGLASVNAVRSDAGRRRHPKYAGVPGHIHRGRSCRR
jgi:hypothetical protein